MANNVIARPYAKAAFEIAAEDGQQQKGLAEWSKFLHLLAQVVSDEAVQERIKYPLTPKETLSAFLLDVATNVPKFGDSFVKLLSERRRLDCLPLISELFENYRLEAEQSANVSLTVSRPLNDTFLDKFKQALNKRLNKEVHIECQIDESILGGAIVKIGDLVIDGSAQGKLRKLTEALIA